jgi:GNAT superfamily N-acetyltransferase
MGPLSLFRISREQGLIRYRTRQRNRTEQRTHGQNRSPPCRGRLWVASTGNIPVGFALVKMLADDLPHLEEIDVDPSHGRRGLGTALVRAVCKWATVSGYVMLTLTTFRAVAWNLPFYARLGFEEIPRETLRPELAAVVSEEADRGLDPDTGVVKCIDACRHWAANDDHFPE